MEIYFILFSNFFLEKAFWFAKQFFLKNIFLKKTKSQNIREKVKKKYQKSLSLVGGNQISLEKMRCPLKCLFGKRIFSFLQPNGHQVTDSPRYFKKAHKNFEEIYLIFFRKSSRKSALWDFAIGTKTFDKSNGIKFVNFSLKY